MIRGYKICYVFDLYNANDIYSVLFLSIQGEWSMAYQKPKLLTPETGSLDIGSAIAGVIGKSKVFV